MSLRRNFMIKAGYWCLSLKNDDDSGAESSNHDDEGKDTAVISFSHDDTKVQDILIVIESIFTR